ncbi:MAG: Fe-S oxidoreductase, partial [Verrucomicrobia bacterium]|nr:Fe-S oxidoreductase [Verrucomicrobiota bacterium]
RSSGEALAELPESVLPDFTTEVKFHALELVRRVDSKLDGASKLIFRTAAGDLIETVILRIATGRTSLCVSSQAGCAAACAFCATGALGFKRNLTTEEILDQVIQANQILSAEKRKVRNVVFMGMGEPFHNERAVHGALDILRSPQGFAFDESRLLVSTVGVPEAMVRLVEKFPRIGLALSLHSAVKATRERLIPQALKHSLTALQTAARTATDAQPGRELMIEYTMLDGVNDSDAEMEALAEWLRDLPVHVNLIPYNAIPTSPELQPTPRARIMAFAKELRARGFPVTVRYSLGADIAAACGTLAAKETPQPVG